MDCTLIIPLTVTKFSHAALKALLIAQMNITGDVSISCDWAESANYNDPPVSCVVHLPETQDCAEIPKNLFSLYDPKENDEEEQVRIFEESKRDDPLAKELLEKIATLEAALDEKQDKVIPDSP